MTATTWLALIYMILAWTSFTWESRRK